MLTGFLLVLSGALFAEGGRDEDPRNASSDLWEASVIDEILEAPQVSFAQAALFVQAAAESSVGMSDFPDRPITTGELSFLIMKAFNIKGSFLYAIFPGPRYSYRELKFQGFLSEPSDPGMKVSGPQLLQIVERILNQEGSK